MELNFNLPTVTAALLLSAFFPISFIALVALLVHHMPLSPHADVDWSIARRFPSVEAFRHWSAQMEAAHRQREVVAFQAYSITLRRRLDGMDPRVQDAYLRAMERGERLYLHRQGEVPVRKPQSRLPRV